jgi:hypothetical protein
MEEEKMVRELWHYESYDGDQIVVPVTEGTRKEFEDFIDALLKDRNDGTKVLNSFEDTMIINHGGCPKDGEWSLLMNTNIEIKRVFVADIG